MAGPANNPKGLWRKLRTIDGQTLLVAGIDLNGIWSINSTNDVSFNSSYSVRDWEVSWSRHADFILGGNFYLQPAGRAQIVATSYVEISSSASHAYLVGSTCALRLNAFDSPHATLSAGSGGNVTISTSGSGVSRVTAAAGGISIDTSSTGGISLGTLNGDISIAPVGKFTLAATSGTSTITAGAGLNIDVAGSATNLKIRGEQFQPDVGNTNGNYLKRVAGIWQGAALTIAPSGITLTDGHILVGGIGGTATDVAMSGDTTISDTGAVTIANLAVTNAKIANSTIDLTAKVTGILPVANGGTGLATLTAHALYVGNGTSAPTALAVGTTDQVLLGASAADPAWTTLTGDVTISAGVTAIGSAKVTNAMLAGSIDLTTKVTGTLPVGNGGTGVANPTAHAIYVGAGSSAMASAGVGTAGQLLVGQGAAADPIWKTVSGDLTMASSGAATVTAVQGVAVKSGLTTTDGYVLTYVAANSRLELVAASGGGTTDFADNTFTIHDDGDATKKIAFQASGITTGTTRTLTAPDLSGTLVLTTGAQTIDGKTITGQKDITFESVDHTISSANAINITAGAASILSFTGTTLFTANTDTLSVTTGKTGTTNTGLRLYTSGSAKLIIEATAASGTITMQTATGAINILGGNSSGGAVTVQSVNSTLDLSAITNGVRIQGVPIEPGAAATTGQVLMYNSLGRFVPAVDHIANAFNIVDNADTTKKIKFDISNVTAATTRTYTAPNVTGSLGVGALTNHALQVGGGSTAALTSLSVGATDTVLIGNTGADPSFSGSPTVTTQARGDNSTKVATTAYVDRTKAVIVRQASTGTKEAWDANATGYKTMTVILVGGGGGGGSGMNGTTAAIRGGGGGGGAGLLVWQSFDRSSLGDFGTGAYELYCGAGGAGGAGKTVAGSGNQGTGGQASNFRVAGGGSALVTANGGSGGGGGTSGTVAGGTAGASAQGQPLSGQNTCTQEGFGSASGSPGSNGGAGSDGSAAGTQGDNAVGCPSPTGGGGGGGIPSGGATERNGGAGGAGGWQGGVNMINGGTAGTVAGGNGGAGNGPNSTMAVWMGGTGGGGSRSTLSASGAAGTGGAGAAPGGGGGGGGAHITNGAQSSGPGGAGADGYALILYTF